MTHGQRSETDGEWRPTLGQGEEHEPGDVGDEPDSNHDDVVETAAEDADEPALGRHQNDADGRKHECDLALVERQAAIGEKRKGRLECAEGRDGDE